MFGFCMVKNDGLVLPFLENKVKQCFIVCSRIVLPSNIAAAKKELLFFDKTVFW